MGNRDEAFRLSVQHDHVVDTHSADRAAVGVTVAGCEDDLFGSIFRIEEAVAERSASNRCGEGGSLFGVEGVFELIAQLAAQALEVGVSKRIHLTLSLSFVGWLGPLVTTQNG